MEKKRYGPKPIDRDVRFDRKFTPGKEGECWEWRGTRNNAGAPIFYLSGCANEKVVVQAHRYMYKRSVGEIPENMLVIRTCNNVLCVNPAHLKLMTQADNLKRLLAQRTTFRCGHPITPENSKPKKHGKAIECVTCYLTKHRWYGERPHPKFCPAGHEYTLDNSYQRKDRVGHAVICKTCNRIRGRASKRAERAAKKKAKT